MPTTTRKLAPSDAAALARRTSLTMSPNDLILAAKLGYEWKNIYRMLSAKHQKTDNEEHIIEVSEFDKVC